ncbi:MAG: hypothetical protein ACD_45C00416G0005 [uncultured bacterium]|nr:MAG: hypothetical protein ACD_45C00416G0005 [uncultured bacterium]
MKAKFTLILVLMTISLLGFFKTAQAQICPPASALHHIKGQNWTLDTDWVAKEGYLIDLSLDDPNNTPYMIKLANDSDLTSLSSDAQLAVFLKQGDFNRWHVFCRYEVSTGGQIDVVTYSDKRGDLAQPPFKYTGGNAANSYACVTTAVNPTLCQWPN